MSRTEDLLSDILDELRALRLDVADIRDGSPDARPLYNSDDRYRLLEDIKDGLERLGDRITGGAGGYGGEDLGDVKHAIEMLDLTVQAK